MIDTSAWPRLMRRGDFEAAWRLSDAYLRDLGDASTDHLPPWQRTVWRGKPLEGRVLVRCYRGYGDVIMCSRFVARIADAVIAAPAPLLPLLSTTFRTIDERDEVDYDVDIEVMELMHAFRVTPAGLSAEVPYLRVAGCALPVAGRRIGLVAQSGTWDERRNVPRELIERLADVADIRPLHFGASAETDTPLGLARTIAALDLVISVDTFAAHLAGALGRPVWTLLHSDADWRWLEGRSDSPWYPTMRLFRQREAGEWAPVIDEVARELARAGLCSSPPLV